MASCGSTNMISSAKFMAMPSSVTFGMKFGVQPWMGCGFQAGCPFAGAPNFPKTSLRSWRKGF